MTSDILLCEDDTSCGSEPKQDGIGREDHGDEVLGLLVHGLEVDLLASRTREHGAKLEPDEETAEGENEAEDPEHQGRADGPDRPEDGGGRGEDARADDTSDAGGNGSLVGRYSGVKMRYSHEEGATEDTQMATKTSGGVCAQGSSAKEIDRRARERTFLERECSRIELRIDFRRELLGCGIVVTDIVRALLLLRVRRLRNRLDHDVVRLFTLP